MTVLGPDVDRDDAALGRLLDRVVTGESWPNRSDDFSEARTAQLRAHVARIPTKRELEVLTCLSFGRTGAEAAAELGYTVRGLDEKLRHIRRKLGANTTAACCIALRRGLIE